MTLIVCDSQHCTIIWRFKWLYIKYVSGTGCDETVVSPLLVFEATKATETGRDTVRLPVPAKHKGLRCSSAFATHSTSCLKAQDDIPFKISNQTKDIFTVLCLSLEGINICVINSFPNTYSKRLVCLTVSVSLRCAAVACSIPFSLTNVSDSTGTTTSQHIFCPHLW